MAMYGIKINAHLPYFANFRKPTSTSNLTTYPIPPYTTIRGLLSSSLGLNRDDYTLQEWDLKIGIEVRRKGDRNKELTSILKLVARERAFK
ncbi:MAG: CRISPR-associated protein Cas5, partial [archaeon]